MGLALVIGTLTQLDLGQQMAERSAPTVHV